jgi:DNA-binding XRE family transcriptional regulator
MPKLLDRVKLVRTSSCALIARQGACNRRRQGVEHISYPQTRGCFMYASPQRQSNADVQELRRAGGVWLRELRERCGLSQRELARLVGAEYYTFISQLETGRGRVPPDRYRAWATALQVDPKLFVKNLLKYYDPMTYDVLFDSEP